MKFVVADDMPVSASFFSLAVLGGKSRFSTRLAKQRALAHHKKTAAPDARYAWQFIRVNEERDFCSSLLSASRKANQRRFVILKLGEGSGPPAHAKSSRRKKKAPVILSERGEKLSLSVKRDPSE